MDLAISYSRPMRLLLGVVGVGPRHSCVVVGSDDVEVRMGWGFRTRFPRRSVVAATPWPQVERRPGSRGAHGWRGRWLVSGSSE
jgi:hypothetical protein